MPLVSTECCPNVQATVVDFTCPERYHSVFGTKGMTNFLSPPSKRLSLIRSATVKSVDAAVLVAVSEETSSCPYHCSLRKAVVL